MKFLTTLPVILICLLFCSAKPATFPKSTPGSDPKACTYHLAVNNQGTQTINHVKIEWPGYVGEWYPSIPSGAWENFQTTFDITKTMRYLVKVTVWFASPANGPKLRLTTNSDSKLIGAFNSTEGNYLSTAPVSGTNGSTAIYCAGVTLLVDSAD